MDKSIDVCVCVHTHRDIVSDLGEQYIISDVSTSAGFLWLKYFVSQTAQLEIMDFL